MKRIWIVNQYATCPSRGKSCRHFLLARELVKQGYEITIIAGSGHYFHHTRPEFTGQKNIENIEGVDFIWIKTFNYKQSQNLRRGISWLIFFLKLLFLRCYQRSSPSIIIHSSPSLIPFPGSYFLSWRFGAKIIFEFRDVWPLTFIEVGNFSRFHPIVLVQQWIEKFAVRKSDACIGSMELGSIRLEELDVAKEKYHWLPNGISDEAFKGKSSTFERHYASSDQFLFGYVGSHGKANALETILDAAKYLNGYPIHIVMVGEGSERNKLKEIAKSLCLNNITFENSVSKKEMPSLLASLDGFLISWQDKPMYKYGTSANKLAEYFAAGKPVVQAYTGAGDNVMKFDAGITVPANNAEDMANAMKKIATTSKQGLEEYSMNAKRAAHENFTFKALAIKLSKVLETLYN